MSYMNCIDLITDIARRFINVIEQQPGVHVIPTPEYGWENHRYRSPKFRLAHVEIFSREKLGVVHCCIFPNVYDPNPIYGFDVIAGENKITGVFLDLSPTVSPVEPFLTINVESNRQRPEWGSIFSEHWLACRPNIEEMQIIGDEAVKLLSVYFSKLGDISDRHSIIGAQNNYCYQQRKNEHTRRALTNLIGAEKTEEFMTQILFPCIS